MTSSIELYDGKDWGPEERTFWGLPKVWVERVRLVLGSIELDPSSCKEANDKVIKAERYFDRFINGLDQSWKCKTMTFNPPFSQGLIGPFVNKFASEWSLGNIGEAIAVVKNDSSTKWFETLSRLSNLRAEPRKRFNFIGVEGRQTSSPTFGVTIFYFGNNGLKFAQVFSEANCRIVKAFV